MEVSKPSEKMHDRAIVPLRRCLLPTSELWSEYCDLQHYGLEFFTEAANCQAIAARVERRATQAR